MIASKRRVGISSLLCCDQNKQQNTPKEKKSKLRNCCSTVVLLSTVMFPCITPFSQTGRKEIYIIENRSAEHGHGMNREVSRLPKIFRNMSNFSLFFDNDKVSVHVSPWSILWDRRKFEAFCNSPNLHAMATDSAQTMSCAKERPVLLPHWCFHCDNVNFIFFAWFCFDQPVISCKLLHFRTWNSV